MRRDEVFPGIISQMPEHSVNQSPIFSRMTCESHVVRDEKFSWSEIP